jgi:DNA-binding HxlR family transcriptional regulator
MSNKQIHCPVETTVRVIGGKWKPLILFHLLHGTQRFGALSRALPGIAGRTLTKQLRELEADGVIAREEVSSKPLRVDYSLTELGHSLRPVLLAMHAWGEQAEPSGGDNGNGSLRLDELKRAL